MTTITEPVQLEQPPCPPPLFEPGDLVVVTNHPGRAGQYGEVSLLPASRGRFYVRIAPVDESRDKVRALNALAHGRHGAVAMVELDQLRKVA
jgi:hypothetical protein